MSDAPTLEIDADHLRDWIGREDVATDEVSADLVAKFNATFDVDAPYPTVGDVAPRFIHFCLTQAIRPMSQLGRDGHPERGGFMPPVPLPRRMRAGGSVSFHDDLRVGDTITRTARVADVAVAADVADRILQILQREGAPRYVDAMRLLRELRESGRYMEDVWGIQLNRTMAMQEAVRDRYDQGASWIRRLGRTFAASQKIIPAIQRL